MKTFTSFDGFPTINVWLVKRPDPKKKGSDSEKPKPGEEIMLDGKPAVVEKAEVHGDSECNYWPEIAIKVRQPTV